MVMREKQLTFGPFRIEPREHALYRGPTRLALGTRPLRLLAHLVRNSGRLVTNKHRTEGAALSPDEAVALALRVDPEPCSSDRNAAGT